MKFSSHLSDKKVRKGKEDGGWVGGWVVSTRTSDGLVIVQQLFITAAAPDKSDLGP